MKMKLIVAAIAGAFALSAFAASAMTSTEYNAQKSRLEADYKVAKEKCNGLTANTKDICQAEVKGQHEVAIADLKATYKPTDKAQYDARVAKADAQYKVAKEKCDDLKGNDKDVCVKQAKADYTKAKADAKVAKAVRTEHTTTAAATTAATQGSTSKSVEKVIDAKRDANLDKRDADYNVAKEKCDAMAGQAKDNCISQAKLKFGK